MDTHNNTKIILTSTARAYKGGVFSKKSLPAAVVAITTSLVSPLGFSSGEPAGERSYRALEEVVVTARRREESQQSVPVSITAFDGDLLSNMGVEKLDDLQAMVPSFSISATSGRQNQPVYSLRGIRPTESIYGQDPTVAIYLADVVLSPAKGSNLGMYDLESLQVLQGPQGTLFGRNTTGGAILLTPKKPGEEFGGSIMVGAGNFGKQETEFGVDLPVSDSFALRVAGKMSDSDGYQKNVAEGPLYGKRLGGGESKSMRVSAAWDVSDWITNDTIFTWDKNELDGRGIRMEAVNPDSTLRFYNGGAPYNLPSIFEALERSQSRDVHKIESDLEQASDVKVWGIINTTTFSVNDNLDIKSIAAYRDLEGYEVIDLDGTAIPHILDSYQWTTMKHASYELQFLGTAMDGKLDWTAGLYWYYEKGDEDSLGFTFEPIITYNPFTQLANIDNQSYSVFSQGSYSINDKWSLTAGVRWTYDEKELTTSNYTAAACSLKDENDLSFPMDSCSLTLDKSFSEPTGTLSIEYQPIDDTMIYLAGHRGYRAGGFNVRASRFIEYEPFEAETVTDVELGIKTDWYVGDWTFRTNATAYYQWYDEIQRSVSVLNSSGIPGSAVQNAAKAKVYGFEIEQVISPVENLAIRLSYTYINPEYESWEEPATGEDLSDTPFYFTPEHAFSAMVNYSIPLDHDNGKLRFSATASYKDDVWINAMQTIKEIRQTPESIYPALQQEAFWLVDASLGWDRVMGSDVDISLYAKNITNEEYADGGVMGYQRSGWSTKSYAAPRTYGVQLKYNF